MSWKDRKIAKLEKALEKWNSLGNSSVDYITTDGWQLRGPESAFDHVKALMGKDTVDASIYKEAKAARDKSISELRVTAKEQSQRIEELEKELSLLEPKSTWLVTDYSGEETEVTAHKWTKVGGNCSGETFEFRNNCEECVATIGNVKSVVKAED